MISHFHHHHHHHHHRHLSLSKSQSLKQRSFNRPNNMKSSMISATTFSSPVSSNLSKKYLGSGFFGGGGGGEVNKRNPNWVSNGFLRISSGNLSLKSPLRSSRLVTCCSTISTSKSMNQGGAKVEMGTNGFFLRENRAESNKFTVGVGSPKKLPTYFPLQKLSFNDQVVFLMAFIACTTSLAFASLVAAVVPTLYAMGRAAISLSKLADTAREELPSTMAAVRLSGMEISDLTLELSDLSQEIADGVNKSAQAVQAAEAGIRRIGSLARQQTISMIQERASLPIISIQPVVVGAAKKTSRAVGQATKSFMNMISRGEFSSNNNYDNENYETDRIEL